MTSSAMQSIRVETGARRRSHRGLWIALALVLLVLLVLGGTAGGAWYFSQQLLDSKKSPKANDLKVLAVTGTTITLQPTRDSRRPGYYALLWDNGGAILGPIVRTTANGVVREIRGNMAGFQTGTGTHVEAHVYTTPAALHIHYQTVTVPDPLGGMPAWYVPGRSHTWVVEVHGRNADRREGIRPMPVLTSMGFPILDITYRNDTGAPPSSDHLYHLGATEWQDVQAGVEYALKHGATSVVLYGYSMGGGLVENFLHRSPDAAHVNAVVLDAPALDWSSILDLAAGQRNLPPFLTEASKGMVALRLGLSGLNEINALTWEHSLTAPTLLFHGTDDTLVPIGPSRQFARARPDLVEFVPVKGADHTQSWNVDPQRYDRILRQFLTRTVG